MLDNQKLPDNFSDLNSPEICDWWTQFSEERSDDDGVLVSPDSVYQELISRAKEIDCNIIEALISDEIVSGPFAVGLIMDLVPLETDPFLQLEMLQVGMSTLEQWPEMSFDGFHVDFLQLMWKTLEVVDQKILDSSDSDVYLDRFLESDKYWLHPIVLSSIVALKSPNAKSLDKLLNLFLEIWDFESQSLIEFNNLDISDNWSDLDSVAALLAVATLCPNAPSKLVTKVLEITTWSDYEDFGLSFWEYVCALISRGDDSFFEAPSTAWRDGFFLNGLWSRQVYLSSKSEVRCLTFYMENRDELGFEWPDSDEPRTLKEVMQLLSKHPEAEKKVQKEANRISIELSE